MADMADMAELEALREEVATLRQERDALNDDLHRLKSQSSTDPRLGQALHAIRELKSWIRPETAPESTDVRAPFEQLRKHLASQAARQGERLN